MHCFQALVVFLLIGLAATALQGYKDPPKMNSDSTVYKDASTETPVGHVSEGKQVDLECFEGAWVKLIEPSGFVVGQRVNCGGPCKKRFSLPHC